MDNSATQGELEAGRGYEALFVPALFAPWTGHVLDGAGVQDNDHVLDVACGSGVLARDALARSGQSGRVVGIDPAPGMIAAARETEPGIEWVLGSAEALPFDSGSFDCTVSQFGMMFFQDRSKAADEMYRVTKPGGKLATAIWNSIDQNPAYRDIVAVLDEHVSTAAGDAVRVPFCLGNANEVADILSQAGFGDVGFETKTEQATFPSSRTMVEVELRGWLPLFGINLSEEKIADVLIKSDAKLSKYAAPSGEARFQTSAYIMTARKPH
ncbi:methyltransferase domain-containing protein [Anderseniella sp. Alg231-50]|uniref:methyltransferase domain-containing protein n=1 Tax=Anderseniella sp. Alg231-50 TaxID=1922226 RepID=UPI000D54DD72